MPLGSIHLQLSKPDREDGANAEFFCRVDDAIAAIHPERLSDFPDDAICVDCLKAYRETEGRG